MYKLRLVYMKSMTSVYIPSIDICDVIAKALIRIGAKLSYSNGKNVKPEIVNASTLPIGFESDGEICDVIIKEHMDMSDEKGDRYLIRLNVEDRTYDYYVFPKPDDFKFDEVKKKLKQTQVNYLLEVFANILNEYNSLDLISQIDKLCKEQIRFMVNISYNAQYGRNNVSFYPERITEDAVDLQ